ncbi:MAG TPA: aldo/keto reductase [Spirochaetes bacterium]|nr:aldo/keto reductase [Spirochaetota bacterium]
MEKRRLGRTEHMSSVITFGAAVFVKKKQREADRVLEILLERGVNQIDVAPEYEPAEKRVGKWMKKHRKLFFLNCKTLMRKKDDVRKDLYGSLERLNTDHFDMYSLHSVDTDDELETTLGPGGGMQIILDARSQGLLKYVGITSHRLPLLIKALRMFDFDAIMFPLNFICYADAGYRADYNELMELARSKDVGVMVIKAIAKRNWGEQYHNTPTWDMPYTTWYEPFSTPAEIKRSLDFVLAQNISTAVSASDATLLTLMLDAAEKVSPVDKIDQNSLLDEAERYKPLVFTFSP